MTTPPKEPLNKTRLSKTNDLKRLADRVGLKVECGDAGYYIYGPSHLSGKVLIFHDGGGYLPARLGVLSFVMQQFFINHMGNNRGPVKAPTPSKEQNAELNKHIEAIYEILWSTT